MTFSRALLCSALMRVQVVRRAPLVLRLGAFLVDKDYPGGYKLLRAAERRGWLRKVVRYRLSDTVTLDVPIFRPENRWTAGHVAEYERELVDELSAAVRDAATTPVFVDCGADIGTISARVAAAAARVGRVIAIEPNPDAQVFLERNMGRLPADARVVRAAVADFSGRGRLRRPSPDADHHAQYLEPAPDGDVAVVRIDDLAIDPGGSVVMKLDLEGGERAALKGAMETLRRAREFTVAFEAHPDVVDRTGDEPVDIVRLITGVRPCTVTVPEVPGLEVDLDRPLFAQIPAPERMGYNVVCRSEAAA